MSKQSCVKQLQWNTFQASEREESKSSMDNNATEKGSGNQNTNEKFSSCKLTMNA